MTTIASEIEGGQGQVNQSQPDGLADSLIRVNGLSYRMPSNMSVVVSRNMKRSFANLDSYQSGGKIIITWNSGSEYVNGMNSYLTFDASVDTGVATLGSGSAINFIDSVTVTSLQGTEVDRTEGVASYARDNDRYTYSQDYLNNIGSVMGYASTEKGVSGAPVPVVVPALTAAGTPADPKSRRFCIPLSKLCGLCNTSVLLPSMLSGGLRFEIKLADFSTALENAAGTTTGYTLTNVNMMLDSYQLADSIQKRLMAEASATGLEFFYETWDRTKHNITLSNKANITVRKAVSRALSAFAKTRTIVGSVDELKRDSQASEPNKVSGMFWRLGSLNFPNQRLTSLEEQYFYAQYAMGKLQHPHKNNSVSLDDFKDTEGIVAVSLERSSVLSLSGLPVNNSRTLQVELDYSSSENRDIDIYMRYLQLARVFPNNILVKE
jgi:hypothetical protein